MFKNIDLDFKCIIVIKKIYRKVDDEEGWVVLSGTCSKQTNPMMMNDVSSTRSTDFVNAYRLSR